MAWSNVSRRGVSIESTCDPATESGFSFADPDVGIEWPDLELIHSERDRTAPRLAEIAGSLPFRA